MQWFKLRPTFQYVLPHPQQSYIDRLTSEYRRLGNPKLFLMHGEYGELHLPTDEHRLWSPHLSFSIEPDGDKSKLYGRFAPRVEIWTSVWIFYLVMAFSCFFSLLLAYTQWTLRESIWGLWIAIGSVALIAMLYLIAHVGQQLSVDQMYKLQAQLDQLIAIEVPGDRSILETDHSSIGPGIGVSNSSSPSPCPPSGI